MKAISLWQPWASAIPLGFKLHETRGWATRYRGPIAIHAARRWGREQQQFAMRAREHVGLPTDLPLGAVVAVAWLHDCRSTEQMCPLIGFQERLFGDYRPGRFVWMLDEPEPLREPLPFVGKQGFFEVPDELLTPLVDLRRFAGAP